MGAKSRRVLGAVLKFLVIPAVSGNSKRKRSGKVHVDFAARSGASR
jgi:hypothetical protein